MREDILAIDWSQVRPRRAAAGVVVVLVAFIFVGVAGNVAVTVGLGALFVTAASGDGSMRDRLHGMITFTLFGALIGGFAFWSAGSVIAVAAVFGAATLLGTLAAAYGPLSARRGLFLTLWALLALLLGSTDTAPLSVALAFIAGGAIAIVVTAARLALSREDAAAEFDDAPGSNGSPRPDGKKPTIAAVVRGPIGTFAIIRTAAVVVAVLLGFWLFSSYPLWVAITVVVVVRPAASESLHIVVERTIGTALGAGIAILVAQALPRSNAGIVIAFLVCAFLMLAFLNANYTLFATFLTATLVFAQRLVELDAFEAGWQRLLATAVGAVVGLAAIGLGMLAARDNA